jgi:hypothetical protein
VTVLSGVFSVAGASLSILAVRHFVRRQAFVRTSAVAPGEIVKLREERDGTDLQRSSFPTVRFRNAAGHAFTFESGTGTGGDALHVGDAVRVRYQPDRPEIAEIDSFMSLWGPTLLFAILGAVFLFVGLGLWTGLIPV